MLEPKISYEITDDARRYGEIDTIQTFKGDMIEFRFEDITLDMDNVTTYSGIIRCNIQSKCNGKTLTPILYESVIFINGAHLEGEHFFTDRYPNGKKDCAKLILEQIFKHTSWKVYAHFIVLKKKKYTEDRIETHQAYIDNFKKWLDHYQEITGE